MRCVVQRVQRASVTVHDEEVATIARGILALVASSARDDEHASRFLAKKIACMRIFPSCDGKKESHLSICDISGEVLVVPQFTLMGDVRKGNRPSFSRAADPQLAKTNIRSLISGLEGYDLVVKGGAFGEHMRVMLVNDGPYTVLVDSEKTF